MNQRKYFWWNHSTEKTWNHSTQVVLVESFNEKNALNDSTNFVSLNDSTSFANIVEKTEKNDSTKKVSWNDSTQNDLLNDSTLERMVIHSTVESFNAKTLCNKASGSCNNDCFEMQY